MKRVTFWFDFISPYSWLALRAAPEFAAEHDVSWDLRPILYSALLDHHGLLGPAETEAKRHSMLNDVARCARLAGLELIGPPQHPFRSLDALRVATLFRDEADGLDLAIALASAAWEKGCDLSDARVLRGVIDECGLDADSSLERAQHVDNKSALRELTDDAISRGVFGVPSFALGRGELFWGHDRMAHVAAALAGQLDAIDVSELLARPRGVDRKRLG